MKVIIDLIEDIRESITNAEEYELRVGLLKEDPVDSAKLLYAGEAVVNSWELDESAKVLRFKIGGSDTKVLIGELIPQLLILGMDAMMYSLKIDVNMEYKDLEVVGFGKNDEEKPYILFIKL